MTEKQTLLAILVVLHLVEGAQWFQHGGLVLRQVARGRFRRTAVGDLIGNNRGGVALLGPLPPFGEVFSGRPLPCALAPEGVCFGQVEQMPGAPSIGGSRRVVAWDVLTGIKAEDKQLRLGTDVLWTCETVQAAHRLAANLRELAKTPAAQRPGAIERELRRRLDPKNITQTVESFRQKTHWLRRLSPALFAWLVVVCPVVVGVFGWMPALWVLVPVLLALTIATGETLRRRHRDLYPEAGDERFKLTLLGWLAPLVGIRAVSVLARPLLGEFHPLALAFALAPDQAPALARGLWRDLRHPRRPAAPLADEAQSIVDGFRAAQIAAMRERLEAQGIRIADLEAPLAASDPANRLYCPRCEAQFTASAEACAECGGVPLVPLGESRS
jgi:hypothetical protein